MKLASYSFSSESDFPRAQRLHGKEHLYSSEIWQYETKANLNKSMYAFGDPMEQRLFATTEAKYSRRGRPVTRYISEDKKKAARKKKNGETLPAYIKVLGPRL